MSLSLQTAAGVLLRYPNVAGIADGVGSPGGAVHNVRNPADGSTLAVLKYFDRTQIAAACDRAVSEFESWRRSDPVERSRILAVAAGLLRERKERIAASMSLENGKPISEARGEVEFSAAILDFFAAESVRVTGRDERTATLRNSVTFEPVGPIAAFTTWNYPLTVPARKAGAAIAAGCTMVLKADENTPASAWELVEALHNAGLPPGVLQLVFGEPSDASEIMISHPGIRKVSFTGSSAVGRLVAERAGRLAKPLMLELGGHAPVLVFADSDVAAVARDAVGAKFHNGGQSCGSPTRFLVQAEALDLFVEEFVRTASDLRVDQGIEETTQVGALGNERRVSAIAELVDDAVTRGGSLLLGGPMDRPGNFWAPSLLTEVPDDARVMREEPFGPLAVARAFDDADEALDIANSLPYGLAAYVFSDSVRTMTEVTERLDVGMIGANLFGVGDQSTYFGGVKDSGYGAEGGPEAVREYQVPKLVSSSRE